MIVLVYWRISENGIQFVRTRNLMLENNFPYFLEDLKEDGVIPPFKKIMDVVFGSKNDVTIHLETTS